MNCGISKKFPFTQKGYRNVVNVEIDILKYWKNLKRIDFFTSEIMAMTDSHDQKWLRHSRLLSEIIGQF